MGMRKQRVLPVPVLACMGRGWRNHGRSPHGRSIARVLARALCLDCLFHMSAPHRQKCTARAQYREAGTTGGRLHMGGAVLYGGHGRVAYRQHLPTIFGKMGHNNSPATPLTLANLARIRTFVPARALWSSCLLPYTVWIPDVWPLLMHTVTHTVTLSLGSTRVSLTMALPVARLAVAQASTPLYPARHRTPATCTSMSFPCRACGRVASWTSVITVSCSSWARACKGEGGGPGKWFWPVRTLQRPKRGNLVGTVQDVPSGPEKN